MTYKPMTWQDWEDLRIRLGDQHLHAEDRGLKSQIGNIIEKIRQIQMQYVTRPLTQEDIERRKRDEQLLRYGREHPECRVFCGSEKHE